MPAINTGYKEFANLAQIFEDTGLGTGDVKANDPFDADYIPPTYDPATCAIPVNPGTINNIAIHIIQIFVELMLIHIYNF